MIYLIPAWYQENKWNEIEQYWYLKKGTSEFDDTVKQMQLFHRNRVFEYKLMLLSYSPNFRHFLHRKAVLRAPYWSCFDAIQEIKKKKTVVFSYQDINWPKGVEFEFTPFVIIVKLKGQKYAKIEFSEDGNLFQIDMYENDVICRRNNYDDRGFVSSTIIYENGNPVHQDYLMENGIWKLREYVNDGHVIINPKYRNYYINNGEFEATYEFKSDSYSSIDLVISEVLAAYIKTTDKDDIFCVAMHSKHMGVIRDTIIGHKFITSFFSNRCGVSDEGLFNLINNAGYIIADSEETISQLRLLVGNEKNIMYMSPYDTRIEKGVSQQLPVQKILVPIDDLDSSEFSAMIEIFGKYLLKNYKAEIHLFSRNSYKSFGERILNNGIRILEAIDQNEEGRLLDNLTSELDEQEVLKSPSERIFLDHCVDELSVSKCIREQRLIVDFRESQDLYLQIVAISVGVPQLARVGSQFLKDGKNGRVLKDDRRLYESLEFYLDTFEHWNSAKMQAYEIGRQYSTDVLIKKWKEVLASFD